MSFDGIYVLNLNYLAFCVKVERNLQKILPIRLQVTFSGTIHIDGI